MPDNSEKSLNENAISSIDPFSNVIKQSVEFVRYVYIEQRLPALILILTIVSLVTVILSSPSDNTKLFLWFTTIPLLLILTFFVLPKQGKEFQKIKEDNKRLIKENTDLESIRTVWNDKLRQVRDQMTDLTNSSLSYLESIERNLNDIKSQVNEFLTSGEHNNLDEYVNELDKELSRLLEYVQLKRQEIDGLQARISGAEHLLETSSEAAKFLASLQETLERNDEETKD